MRTQWPPMLFSNKLVGRYLRRLLVLLCLLGCCASCCAGQMFTPLKTERAMASNFVFTQDSLISLSWVVGSEQRAELQLVALDQKEHKYAVTFSDLGLEDVNGVRLANSCFIKLEPAVGLLSQQGFQQIRLTIIATPNAKSGVY